MLIGIEEEYDNKVGFEIKIQEKKRELYQLKNQLNADRLALQLQPYIGTVLQKLFQNGVSEEDIINMNDFVTKFSKNSSSSTSFSSNTEINDKDHVSNIDNKNDRTKYWKLFIYNLEKLKDIQSEIKEQTENRDIVKNELDYLNKQKQEVTAYLQIALSFINAINHRIYYLKGFVDYFNSDLEKKIDKSRYSRLLSVIIIYINIQKEDNSKDKQ